MKYYEIDLDVAESLSSDNLHHLWLFTEDGAFCFTHQILPREKRLIRAAFMPLHEAHDKFENQHKKTLFFLRTNAQLLPQELVQEYDLYSLYSLGKDISEKIHFQQKPISELDAVLLSYAPAQLLALDKSATDYFFIWFEKIFKTFRSFSNEKPLVFFFVFGEYVTALVLYKEKVQLFNHFYFQTIIEFAYIVHGVLQACNLTSQDLVIHLAGEITSLDEKVFLLKEREHELKIISSFPVIQEGHLSFSSIYWALEEV